jgi:hypothetical protein
MKRNSERFDMSGDADELRELLGPHARGSDAEYFGVTPQTLQRWIDGQTRPPAAVMRLARLRWGGQLAAVLGGGWVDFSFAGGLLHIPGFRRGFEPGELRAAFFQLQRLPGLEHEARRLRDERERAVQAAQAAEDAAGWYRRQLLLEARMGAMLQRLGA